MQRTLPVVILAAAALTGCGGGDGDKTAQPAQAAAKQSIAGGTVTWTNRDKAPHTAETGAGVRGGFDTGRLDQGQSKKIRFDKPGKVRFYCVYHRFMVGTVDVRK
jgi:plastocyanin